MRRVLSRRRRNLLMGFVVVALITSGVFVAAPLAEAQTSISINGTNDADELAAFLFGNECTSVTNAALVGGSADDAATQVGTFSAQGIGIASGVVFSTGAAESLSGTTANTTGNFGGAALGQSDPAIGALASNGAFDAASLTFELTSPIATTITGRYLLASEEWTEYVNSGYADVLAIFVNEINVSLVPGTAAVVSIDSINNNTNSAYFFDNDIHDSSPASPRPLEPDGFTVPIDFTANLIAGVNTIKLGVVDDGDASYDSWAFFEAESFTCPPPAISIEKLADVTSVAAEGDPIQYSFTIVNDGIIPVTNIAVTDPMVGSVTCVATSLAAGASTTCAADAVYSATQPQIDGGEVLNTATVTATDANGTPAEASDDLSIPAAAAPLISIVKSADVSSVSAEGDPISYSFLVNNEGNVTLTGVGVTDAAVGAVTCPVTTLAPDASTTCTADNLYLTTQPQVDAGEFINIASVDGSPAVGDPVSATDSLTIPAPAGSAISIAKSADVASVSAEGDPISYSFLVTNVGNVTLNSVAVTDAAVGTVSCPVTTLAPGASTICTADNLYLTTQSQVDAGEVVNNVSVAGSPPVGDDVTASDSLTIPATAAPLISIVKSADVASVSAEGDPIAYSFLVTNTGNVTLTNVAVTDAAVGSVSCPTTTLAPDASTTCTADNPYLTTQPQVDAGEVINTATVAGSPPTGVPVDDSDTHAVPAPPAAGISMDKSSTTTALTFEGQVVPFELLITNTGNVTLTDIEVVDLMTEPVTCPATSLAPVATMTCTASYSASQDDVDTGSFMNTADVSGTPPIGPDVTDSDTVMTPSSQAPSITLVKSADVTEVDAEGDPISYSFLVANNGNVTLTDVAVSDTPVGAITCPATRLVPGASMTCTADSSYLTTQPQIDAGEVVNTATVTGTPPGNATPETASDTVILPASANPSITLAKAADVAEVTAENDPINYSFLVTNDGNVTLTVVAVTDLAVGAVTCPAATLAPDASTTCTADNPYLTTQPQVDAGQVSNTATVAGTPPTGPDTQATDSLDIPVLAAPLIELEKSSTTTALVSDGQIVPFEFLVTNAGMSR